MDTKFEQDLKQRAELMLLVHGQEIAMKLQIKAINRATDPTQRYIERCVFNFLKNSEVK